MESLLHMSSVTWSCVGVLGVRFESDEVSSLLLRIYRVGWANVWKNMRPSWLLFPKIDMRRCILLATLWRISPAPLCKALVTTPYSFLLHSVHFTCFAKHRLEKRYGLARFGSWNLRQILTISTVRRVLKLISVGPYQAWFHDCQAAIKLEY